MPLPDELDFLANAFKSQKITTARMDGKVCVITGGTSGVGYQAAKRLAEGGAEIVLVCRNPQKGEAVRQELAEAYGTKTSVILADFTRLDEVRRAAGELLAGWPKIDVLINNAGIHRTHRTLTEDGLETVFCVNHLAAFLLTRLLLDRLVASAPAQILYVNSEGHRFGGLDLDDLDWAKRRYRGLQGYGAAKTAQLLTIWELNDLLAGTGVTVNAMHPGAVRTQIGMDNGWLYRGYQRFILWPFLQKPEVSGEAIYYLLAAPEMQGLSGNFYNKTNKETPMPHAMDRALGKQVWAVSEQLTGLPHLPLEGE
jgi:NAD(P)-dependent dehydrogenase (short-subunit alcohol dehydrogenase family)